MTNLREFIALSLITALWEFPEAGLATDFSSIFFVDRNNRFDIGRHEPLMADTLRRQL
jgi:hypothetical protein